MKARHTIQALVRDRPGVLQRIAGLFSRRGYNIESLTVGTAEEEGLSRMTIVARCDERTRDQMVLQLGKLIEVVRATPLAPGTFVSRELMLIKLGVAPEERPAITALAETFRCGVVDVGADMLVVQAVGDVDKNEALLRLLRGYRLIELSRTGETAMRRSGAEPSAADAPSESRDRWV